LWLQNAKAEAKNHREFDPVSDLVGSYKIKFNDNGFNALWSKIKNCDLVYMESILLKNVDTVEREEDAEDWKKKMLEPSAFRTPGGKHLMKGDLVFTDDRGMTYQFGMGGLHNIAPRGVWTENEEFCIFNSDVGSMYPSLIVENDYSPRQFPQFARLMSVLKKERMENKRAKRKIQEQAQKLVLNSSFGKTKEITSVLYDPKACFSVTLSGQLLLMMLIDFIYTVSPRTTVINANTDGVCIYTPRADLAIIKHAMKAWESYSKLDLEDEFYQVWAQSNCNLYCALDSFGTVKSKGRDFKLKVTAMRETMSEAVATKKLMMQALLYHKHPDEICPTLPKEDFQMSTNFGGKRTLVVDGVPQRGRRSLRYAWVKQGSLFQKREARGISIVGEGRPCQLLDDMNALEESNIDYEYYKQKAMIKVLEIVGTHTTLNLPSKVLKDIRVNFDKWFL
jgi:hypothetical protein